MLFQGNKIAMNPRNQTTKHQEGLDHQDRRWTQPLLCDLETHFLFCSTVGAHIYRLYHLSMLTGELREFIMAMGPCNQKGFSYLQPCFRFNSWLQVYITMYRVERCVCIYIYIRIYIYTCIYIYMYCIYGVWHMHMSLVSKWILTM